MTEAVFKATIHGLRTVPSRGVVQVSVEAPIEQLTLIAKIAEHGKWVAVARLNEGGDVPEQPSSPPETTPPQAERTESKPAGADKRPFAGMPYAVQAALRCKDPIFRAFLREMCAAHAHNDDQAADFVRRHCGVNSRADIKPDAEAETHWLEIEQWFAAWQVKERAMA